ncbi:MAG: hypothetical protein ACLSTO_00865 [Bilophila wadsworthia]
MNRPGCASHAAEASNPVLPCTASRKRSALSCACKSRSEKKSRRFPPPALCRYSSPSASTAFLSTVHPPAWAALAMLASTPFSVPTFV